MYRAPSLLALLLLACATASVQEEDGSALPMPDRILVRDFTAAAEHASPEEEALGETLASEVSRRLVASIARQGLPVSRPGSSVGAADGRSLAVEGHLLSLVDGAAVTGVRANRSSLQARVEVWEESSAGRRRVSKFEVSTRRRIYKVVSDGAAAEARATADRISQQLTRLFAHHGWIALPPKHNEKASHPVELILNPILPADSGAKFPPRDVAVYIGRRDACERARKSEVFDEASKRDRDEQMLKYCSGGQARLEWLRAKYAGDYRVQDLLSAYDPEEEAEAP